MKAILIGAAVTVATLALPVAALAATYQYVNINGVLETETADNAVDALTQPTDIAPHSGVLLVTGTTIVTPPATVVTTTSVTPSNTAAGTYTDVLTGVNTPARTMYLTLASDGTAVLSSIYNDSSTPMMLETGTWTGVGNNQIQVTLNGNANETYATPEVLVFNENGTTLTGVTYDSSVYGTQGLTFTQ